MTVTSQLLELFRVDKQLRGLRSRLDAAEKFLATQKAQHADVAGKAAVVDAQIKTLRISISSDEGEAARIDARIASLREQMNSAKTAKEYNAFLSELSTFKEQKSQSEDKELLSMGKVEELEKQASELATQKAEKDKVVAGAESERKAREVEIKDRLAELSAKRAELAAAIPKDAMRMLDDLIRSRGDEAMAVIETVDRRNLEFSCAACMMALPIETVNSVVRGHLTRCVSCQCILFTEDADLVKPVAKQAAKA